MLWASKTTLIYNVINIKHLARIRTYQTSKIRSLSTFIKDTYFHSIKNVFYSFEKLLLDIFYTDLFIHVI